MSAKLAKKLAEVMAAVGRIPKRGRNEFHGYSYATEADIVEKVRKELAARHVILIPEVESMQRDPVGEKGQVLTTLRMHFTFMDGETGETISRHWLGAGTDKEDKGAYKAMTGGEKYFLLKTFLMPTGDDPEADKKQDAGYTVTPDPEKPAKTEKRAAADTVQTVTLKAVKPGRAGAKGELVTEHGESFLAYDHQLVALAEQHCQDKVPVLLTIARSTSGNRYVKSLKRAEPKPETTPATEPLTVDAIPF